jgi:hypothetical protein
MNSIPSTLGKTRRELYLTLYHDAAVYDKDSIENGIKY